MEVSVEEVPLLAQLHKLLDHKVKTGTHGDKVLERGWNQLIDVFPPLFS